MRFSFLHKLTSYLLVAAGFSALAFSGELSPLAVAITTVLGLASFAFEPTRFAWMQSRAWSYLWNAGTVGMFAWTMGEVARGERLMAGVRFLCFLLVNKLWNRRASKDYLQSYLISFLMLVAGTTLNTDLVFAACFFVYVIAATWTLTLFHLRREMEDNYFLKHGEGASERVEVERVLNSRRVVGAGFLAGTSAISASIFAVSSVFFFAFPRVGFNLFFAHARHGMRVGFNDQGVELGGNGLIKDNDQVVMRVEYPGGTPKRPPYFRGISFDRYAQGRWFPTLNKTHLLKRASSYTIVGVDKDTRLAPEFYGEFIKTIRGHSEQQEIYLEPMDTTVLFAEARPVALVLPRSQPGGPVQPEAEGVWLDDEDRRAMHHSTWSTPTLDIYAGGRQSGIRYTAWSVVEPPPAADLARSEITEEELAGLAPYLDVSQVPPAVLELGRRITKDARTPAAKADAIMAHLGRGFRYTLEQVHDPRKEPIEEFLLSRKEGHCEYFASAMALLMRAAGVPARHVAGFYGGQWNEVGHYLQVRQRDAHAWVEVYLGKRLGWVTYDPTPASGSAMARGGLASRLRQMLDVVELAWFKYVIEYDLEKQMDVVSRLRQWIKRDTKQRQATEPSPWRDRVRKHKLAFGVAVVALVGLAFAVRELYRRRPARSRRRVAVRATRVMERAMRALERRGTTRLPSDTPAALGKRAAAHDDPGAAAYAELVILYYEARYGARPVDQQLLERLAATVIRPPSEASSAARSVLE